VPCPVLCGARSTPPDCNTSAGRASPKGPGRSKARSRCLAGHGQWPQLFGTPFSVEKAIGTGPRTIYCAVSRVTGYSRSCTRPRNVEGMAGRERQMGFPTAWRLVVGS
jgi:hypothetical protein